MSSIPDELICTHIRSKRAEETSYIFHRQTNLYYNIRMAIRKNEKEN